MQRLQRVDDGLGVRRKRLERRLGGARAPAGWLDHPHLDDVRKRRPRVVAGGAAARVRETDELQLNGGLALLHAAQERRGRGAHGSGLPGADSRRLEARARKVTKGGASSVETPSVEVRRDNKASPRLCTKRIGDLAHALWTNHTRQLTTNNVTTEVGSNPRPHRRPGRGCCSTAARTRSSSSQSRAASRAADTRTHAASAGRGWVSEGGGR